MRVPWQLHAIAFIVVIATLSAEGGYLFYGTSARIPEAMAGRILGTLDMALALVLGFYFTASISQHRSPQRSSDISVVPADPSLNKGPTS